MLKRVLFPVLMCLMAGPMAPPPADGRSYPPRIGAVRIEGLKIVARSDIESVIESQQGARFSETRMKHDADRLREAIAVRGHPKTRVSADSYHAPNGRVAVKFAVDEGERAPVGGVVIAGNFEFSDADLVAQMKTQGSGLMGLFARAEPYDELEIKRDGMRLAAFYAKHGYPDFRVLSSIAEYDDHREHYFVTLMVDEGQRDAGGMTGADGLRSIHPF